MQERTTGVESEGELAHHAWADHPVDEARRGRPGLGRWVAGSGGGRLGGPGDSILVADVGFDSGGGAWP